MIRVSIKQLRVICQSVKYDYNYPLMFRLLRLVSIYPTWLFIQINAVPNHITLAGIFAGIASAVALYNGSVTLAVALILFAVVADFSDGEVSRYFKTTSKEGTFLDKVHHIVVHSSFLAGIVLWVNNQQPSGLIVAMGLICVLGSIYLPFINIYAIDVALFKHVKRALIAGSHEYRNTEKINSSEVSKNEFLEYVKAAIAQLNRLLDFPYVVFIFSASILYDTYCLSGGVETGLVSKYTIILYAILSCCLILLFLVRIVCIRHIEARFNSELITRNSNINL